MTVDRVRTIAPNGDITVRDLAFSQICELTQALSKTDRKRFWAGERVVTTEPNHFAPEGSDLKYMGPA